MAALADVPLHKKALVIIEYIAKMWGGGDVSEDEAYAVFMVAHSAIGECDADSHSDWIAEIEKRYEKMVEEGLYDPRQRKAGLN